MKPIGSTCLRIRDTNESKIDVEKFIKSLEDRFEIDFRTLPKWKNLIEKMYFVSDYKERIIHDVNLRKFLIINKLCIEKTKLTTFELTDRLIRTANNWQKSQWIKQRPQVDTSDYKNISGPLPSVQTSMKSGDVNASVSRLDEIAEEEIILDENKNDGIDTNKVVPALDIVDQKETNTPSTTIYSDLSYHTLRSDGADDTGESNPTVCHSMNFKLIECYPKEIVITNNSPKKQVLKFSLKNMSFDYIYIRFKNLTNCDLFKRAKVFPYLTVKMYPGLSVAFKFVFNLMQTKDDFITSIIFLVQYKDCNESLLSEYCVNILSQFIQPRCVKISEAVHIPPVYAWHLNPKSGYPRGYLTVEVNDENEYYIRIIKNKRDLTEIESCNSNNATMQSTSDSIKEISSNSLRKSSTVNQSDITNIDYFILSIIKDVLDVSLDTFVFDVTCLCLPRNSKRKIYVYLNKCEYIGYHQSYFDVEFRNVDTYELIETKTTKVFAEILPHPIEIVPTIFDTSATPVVHGICVDHFVVTNKHKVYSTTIRIEASNVTKKLIAIKPMTVFLHPETSVKFQVRTCPTRLNFEDEPTVMVHFTIKIKAAGVKTVYDNIPSIYYEIIAPCALEFCKKYNLDTM